MLLAFISGMKKLIFLTLLLAVPMLAQEAPVKQIRRSTHERVYNDTTRLAALLRDAQSNINYSDAIWKAISNESSSLANRIWAGTVGNNDAHAAAKDLRMHVREMRDAAMKGDATAARTHANMALPYAYTIIDWSYPPDVK